MVKIQPSDKIFYVEQNSPSKEAKKTPLLGSARLGLAVMCFTACITLYTQNSSLSLTMVCMLNHTAINSHLQPANASPAAHFGRCPARNGSEAESKSDGEFAWDKETQGLVLGAYFWGYCIPQMFYGVLSQKYGAKYVMLIGMFVSACLTLLTPLAAQAGFAWLIVSRVLMGLAASVLCPTIQTLWSKWAPRLESSLLIGTTFVGCETGNIVAFALSGEVCATAGWQTVFYMFGGLGVVCSICWLFFVSESPAVHPRISEEERKYIETSIQTSSSSLTNIRNVPWTCMLTSLPVWAIIVGNFTAFFGAMLIQSELPSYMSEVLRFDIQSNGLFSALPYLAVMVMVPIVTVFADTLRKRWLSTKNVRKIMMILGLCGCGSFLVATGYLECHQTTTAVIFLALSQATYAGIFGGFLVNHGDIAPKYAGILASIGNTLGLSNGFITPMVTSFLTEDQTIDEWRRVFWVAGGVMFCGALFYTLFASGEVQEWAKEDDDENDKKVRF